MCENNRIGVTSEDEEKIKALASEEKEGGHTVYEKIINSIAPSIHGLRFVKESVMLQMFGGVSKKMSDETTMDGNIHILIVGDPGIGKSKILSSVHGLMPNSVLIGDLLSNKNMPSDKRPDKEMLTPEILAMADNGVLIIDNVNFMQSRGWRTLVNVMERGKAPVVRDKKVVETDRHFSTLITASPRFGRFDPYKPISEQIEIPINTLILFDIIFSIDDKPEVKRDSEIAEHILRMHSQKLVNEPEIKPELLKKYITYARKNVFPTLTEEAKKTLKEYYINLRKFGEDENSPVPVTPRQFVSLIKLSEASARIRLSNEVSKEDAERAIKMFEYCMRRAYFDYETGRLDVDIIATGRSQAEAERSRAVLDIINELSQKNKKGAVMGDIIKESSTAGISRYKLENTLFSLVYDGVISRKEYYRLEEGKPKTKKTSGDKRWAQKDLWNCGN